MAGRYKFPSVVFVTFSLFHLMDVSLALDVLELTESNFDSTTQGQKAVLVEFFAPWCSHCRDVLPLFEKAAAKLKSIQPQITLAKVDCVKNKALCEKYDVNFIPIIQLFYKGQALEKLSGDKTQESIIAFAKKAFQDSSSSLRRLLDKSKSGAQSVPALELKIAQSVPAPDSKSAQSVPAADSKSAQSVPALESNSAQSVPAADSSNSAQSVPAADSNSAQSSQSVSAADSNSAQSAPAADSNSAQSVHAADSNSAQSSQSVSAADSNSAQSAPAADSNSAQSVHAADSNSAQSVPAADSNSAQSIPAPEPKKTE